MPDASTTSPAPIDNAPATPIKITPTAGRVESVDGEQMVLRLPGTDYRLHLKRPIGDVPTPGAKLTGWIELDALRVDAIPAGGTYIEPVFGRPRRLQGRVLGSQGDRLQVRCGPAAFSCRLTDARQRADEFPVGVLVSFDAAPGARLTTA